MTFEPELAAAVRAALPGADLEGATRLGEGWATVAWRVGAADGEWALRAPKPGSWWAVEDLERESRLLPGLEAAGLPVPRGARLLLDEADGRVLAAVQRVVPGTAATQRRIGRGREAGFVEDVAGFLAQLHGFPVERAEALGARSLDLWAHEYAGLIEIGSTRLPPRSAAWVARMGREFLAGGGSARGPRVLIHGDVHTEHLLVDERGRLTGVLDWGDAMVADPALDFAGLLNDRPWAFLERVLARYQALGGRVDPDARRRVRFYIEVSPLFEVAYAEDAGFPESALRGRRRIAARAAAARGRG